MSDPDAYILAWEAACTPWRALPMRGLTPEPGWPPMELRSSAWARQERIDARRGLTPPLPDLTPPLGGLTGTQAERHRLAIASSPPTEAAWVRSARAGYPCVCGHALAAHTPEPRTACQVPTCPCSAYRPPAPRPGSPVSAEAWARLNTYHAHLMPAWPPSNDGDGLRGALLGWLAVVAACALAGAGLYLVFGGWRW